jgi:uncharacterized repeat protein (TIGR01451 family)
MRNYFKKFSIMFMMALAIIGIGMIYGVNGVNAATVGQQLTSPESGWRRFEPDDARFIKNGTWIYNTEYFKTSKGIAYYTKSTTDSFDFKFYGSKIRLMVYSDKYSAKDCIINIDGIPHSFSNYSELSTQNSLVYQLDIPLGVHKVTIKTNEPNYVEVDAIDIDNTGDLVNPNESITLDKSTMNLTQGDSGQLVATTTPAGAQVTWKSSDSSVATVDSTGKVTAAKEGTCIITATTADGLTATCVVTIIPKGTDPNPQPTDSENITNIAHAKGTNTNNPGGEVTIIFHGTADTILNLVKTADVKDVWIGDNFTYTLVITNTGTKTAKAVVVNDPAPNHIDFNVSGVTTTQGTVDSSSTSKNIIVNVGDILPGGTVTIKIPSTVIA